MPRKDEKKRIHDLVGIEDSADSGYLLVSHPDGAGGFTTRRIRVDQFMDDITLDNLFNVEEVNLEDGATLTYDAEHAHWHPVNPSIASTPIAAGFTLGLSQKLLASNRQLGKTVLAVPYVSSDRDRNHNSKTPEEKGKVQVTSLDDGNVLFVYASGADFLTQTIQEGPIFLSKGEIYVIADCVPGAIITMEGGGYGMAEQTRGTDVSPMPLLSLALGLNDAFFNAFRNSQGTENEQGWIHVVNGPLASVVNLQQGDGIPVEDPDGNLQIGIELAPWQYKRLYTKGNQEYRLTSSQLVMASINARMGPTTRFYDSRLIMPMTNDGITWPRSGFVSAQFPNTKVSYWVADGRTGDNDGSFIAAPGAPVDADSTAGTGANNSDYEAVAATRFKAAGVISAFSGADSAGLEATPMMATSNLTQRVALPLGMLASGDGGDNGIAIASPYFGTAKLYEWNPATGKAELVTLTDADGVSQTTEIIITRHRQGGAVANRADQDYPASALVSPKLSNTTDGLCYTLTSDFKGGYIEADVPIIVVQNAQQNQNPTAAPTVFFRGTGEQQLPGIAANDDEQLTFGITPDEIRAEVQQGRDGMLYRRVLDNDTPGGMATEQWWPC